MKKKPLKIAAIADIHGILPTVKKADVLIIAGDIFPTPRGNIVDVKHVIKSQKEFFKNTFKPWLNDTLEKVDIIILVSGNHDYLFYKNITLPKNVFYLQDNALKYKGYKFYGSPWTPRGKGKNAFSLTERKLRKKIQKIPSCDVLISHMPPKNKKSSDKSSPELLKIVTKNNIRIVVSGHDHKQYGKVPLGKKTCTYMSSVTSKKAGKVELTKKPLVFTISN